MTADTGAMNQSLNFEPLSMKRRDPDLNMARFYAIALQPTLFGEVSVVRSWGRIGTKGQAKLETFPSQIGAESQAVVLEKRKRRRGYV